MPRLAVVVTLAVLAAACARGQATQTPVLSVEIGDAMPFSDPDDAYNALGDRYWSVTPEVVARLARGCADVQVAVDARALFNGRPDPDWADAYLGGGDQKAPGQRPARFVLRSYADAYAGAGDTIEFAARATCRRDGSTVVATARRRFELPPAECSGGPLRAFEVSGIVKAQWDGEGPAFRLRAGDLVRPGSLVALEKGARAVVGAPECNGFSVTLSPGTYWTGSYDSSGRGLAFSGKQIDAVGDGRAGGFSTDGGQMTATVDPLGGRCRGCVESFPARYSVRSFGRRVVVRVEDGSVRVRGRTGLSVRVRAGEQATVLCRTSECRVTKPRLFQPSEPWASPMAGGERSVRPVLTTSRGERPAARDLAPPRATVETEVLAAAGGVPEQVFVQW